MWSFDYKVGCPRSCVHTLQWSGLRVACASAWGADPHWHWSIDFIQIIIKHQRHKNIVINFPLFPSSHAISEARDVVRCKNNLGYLQYLLRVDKIVCWMKSGGGCGMEIFSGNEQKLIRTQEKGKSSASFHVGKQLHSYLDWKILWSEKAIPKCSNFRKIIFCFYLTTDGSFTQDFIWKQNKVCVIMNARRSIRLGMGLRLGHTKVIVLTMAASNADLSLSSVSSRGSTIN